MKTGVCTFSIKIRGVGVGYGLWAASSVLLFETRETYCVRWSLIPFLLCLDTLLKLFHFVFQLHRDLI